MIHLHMDSSVEAESVRVATLHNNDINVLHRPVVRRIKIVKNSINFLKYRKHFGTTSWEKILNILALQYKFIIATMKKKMPAIEQVNVGYKNDDVNNEIYKHVSDKDFVRNSILIKELPKNMKHVYTFSSEYDIIIEPVPEAARQAGFLLWGVHYCYYAETSKVAGLFLRHSISNHLLVEESKLPFS